VQSRFEFDLTENRARSKRSDSLQRIKTKIGMPIRETEGEKIIAYILNILGALIP
jgi:hypothetical protein